MCVGVVMYLYAPRMFQDYSNKFVGLYLFCFLYFFCDGFRNECAFAVCMRDGWVCDRCRSVVVLNILLYGKIMCLLNTHTCGIVSLKEATSNIQHPTSSSHE